MPLDVQPLSRTRQAVMVLVMLAVLALSLGFAQLLIQGRVVRVTVTFPLPRGVAKLPVNRDTREALAGTLAEARVKWDEGERRLYAFDFDDSLDARPQEYLEVLLDHILPDTMERVLRVHRAVLAHSAAYEGERQVERGDDSTFAIIRLAALENHIVAFCFSGDGGMTDADRQFFDEYCTQGIAIRVDKPGRKG
jgi:hypothetical protein